MPFPITDQCNFNCRFCDRQFQDPNSLTEEGILRDAPMSELGGLRAVLGGGEPTLHPKLPHILKGLRSQKVKKIAIRTNASWAANVKLPPLLKKKGLTDANVLLPTLDPDLFDSLVRKKGAFQATMSGIQNMQSAGIKIAIRIPIIQPTLNELPQMLKVLPTVIPKISRIDLVHLDISAADLQVSFSELNKILPAKSKTLTSKHPPLFLDPGPGLPLCLIDTMTGWNITPDMPTAKGIHPPKCDGCFLKHNCPGVTKGFDAVCGSAMLEPVVWERVVEQTISASQPSYLKGAAVEKVKGLTFECPENEQQEPTLASMRLRVGHQCNRRCEFCFIPHHDKSVQDYDIEKSIEVAVESGVRELVMTGGEPTLQNSLPVYIQKASDLGVRRIVLQTNGVRLADPNYTQQLVDAGLSSVVISLHSHHDDTLAKITKLPNAMKRILKGIDNLHQAGLKTSITHVIGPRNYMDLLAFTQFMHQKAGVKRFCFIFATPMAWPMAKKEIVVKYADAAPQLMAAMDYCIDNGIIVDGLSFKCGAPHCVVNGEPKYLVGAVNIPPQNRTQDWVRVPACQTCVLNDQCYGVRRLYVWLYGSEEFKPVTDPSKRIASLDVDVNEPAGPFPHKVTPHRRPMEAMLDRLGEVSRRMGFPSSLLQHIENALHIERKFITLNGQKIEACRIRHDRLTVPSAGPIAFEKDVDVVSAKVSTLLRSLRASAFELPLAGAHGFISGGLVSDEDKEMAVSRLISEGFFNHPLDYLTPHTSSPWKRLTAIVPRSLRRYSDSQHTKMTSIESAYCFALAGLMHTLESNSQPIRYSIWGLGRAGRRFASRFDQARVHGRRPMLTACCDSRGAWIDSRGLEHERVSGFKLRNGHLPVGSSNQPGDVLCADVDLLVLAGRGESITLQNLNHVKARLIIDFTGAVSPDVEDALMKAGHLFIPSVLTTAGPMILGALEMELSAEPSPNVLRDRISRHCGSLFGSAIALSNESNMNLTDAMIALGLGRMLKSTVSNDGRLNADKLD